MGFVGRLIAFAAAFAAASLALCPSGGGAREAGIAESLSARTPAMSNLALFGSGCSLSQPVPPGEPSRICLALKYVVYEDARGVPVATPADALANLREINLLHGQCGIYFQIEEFDEVEPSRYGLAFNTENMGDLDEIREKFSDPSHLLIVTTGPWNRTGTLGATTANAWTSMPGSAPYGSVIEAPVAKYSFIFAHELGHYLDLEHVENPADLMNPVIYESSKTLTPAQCDTERTIATGFWREVTRS